MRWRSVPIRESAPSQDGVGCVKRSIALIILSGALLALPACKPAAPATTSTGSNSPTAASTSVSSQTAPSVSASASVAEPASPTAPVGGGSSTSRPKPTVSNELHSPKAGTPERQEILNALRVPVEAKLRQPVVFKVSGITVKAGWAFVEGEPLRPDGRRPDYSKTPYAQAVKDGLFGYDVDALLRLKDGTWTVATYYIGATDVEWLSWARKYGSPRG